MHNSSRFTACLLLVFACVCCFLGFINKSEAASVIEVRGVRVERSGEGGREAAVAEATRKAAEQVLLKWGNTATLPPNLTQAELEHLTTYIDVASESVQPNFYGATFNIGIRVESLRRIVNLPPLSVGQSTGGGNNSNADPASSALPSLSSPISPPSPAWVLVVPVSEVGSQVEIWTPDKPWMKAWQRTTGKDGLAFAKAGGDAQDQILLPKEDIQQGGVSIDALQTLAQKYKAPAVAVITLRTPADPPRTGDEIQITVSYFSQERPLQDRPSIETLQGTLFVGETLAADPVDAAVQEGQRLLLLLARNGRAENQESYLSQGRGEVPPLRGNTVPSSTVYGNAAFLPSQTESSPSVGHSTTEAADIGTPPPSSAVHGEQQSLWVRIPVKSPADFAKQRKVIDSIPGVRFEVGTLSRGFVEGTIFYSGDQAILLQELAKRGLATR